MPNHLIRTKDLERQWIEGELFPLCDRIRDGASVGQTLQGRSMYCLFYEPSFLTRASFERAMALLGGDAQQTEDASQFFPVRTTTFIENTIKFLGSLHFDVVVLRSQQSGAAEQAAEAGGLAVINGGSPEDHPTQALLDLYTLQRELGGVDGLNIAFLGRLDHRNVNALLTALAMYKNIKAHLVPVTGQADQDTIDYCTGAGIAFSQGKSLMDLAGSLDAVYVNGAGTPGHAELVRSRNIAEAKVDKELLAALKPGCMILDPMQRSDLVIEETDDPRWAGYRQAENGLYVRMALLMKLLGQ